MPGLDWPTMMTSMQDVHMTEHPRPVGSASSAAVIAGKQPSLSLLGGANRRQKKGLFNVQISAYSEATGPRF